MALPDLQPRDVVGSPYCVRRYRVDPHLGGPPALGLLMELAGPRGALPLTAATRSTTWPWWPLGSAGRAGTTSPGIH